MISMRVSKTLYLLNISVTLQTERAMRIKKNPVKLFRPFIVWYWRNLENWGIGMLIQPELNVIIINFVVSIVSLIQHWTHGSFNRIFSTGHRSLFLEPDALTELWRREMKEKMSLLFCNLKIFFFRQRNIYYKNVLAPLSIIAWNIMTIAS